MEPDRICLRRNAKTAPERHTFGGNHRFAGRTVPCDPRCALAHRCRIEGDLRTTGRNSGLNSQFKKRRVGRRITFLGLFCGPVEGFSLLGPYPPKVSLKSYNSPGPSGAPWKAR